jgi:hypothetical protein
LVDPPNNYASYSRGALIEDLIQTWQGNPSQRMIHLLIFTLIAMVIDRKLVRLLTRNLSQSAGDDRYESGMNYLSTQRRDGRESLN